MRTPQEPAYNYTHNNMIYNHVVDEILITTPYTVPTAYVIVEKCAYVEGLKLKINIVIPTYNNKINSDRY